jgi:DNA repair protein RadA/Sms
VIIVDSIQSIHSEKIEATPGSVVQIRECTSALMQLAKQTNKAIFVIGHVTKEGVIAGPKILEHMVDTVLQFEGEKTYSYRILRAIKNRFGSTNEIGIFDMSDAGLREVSNPSEIFLSSREVQEPGTSIVAAMEGSRPLLLEVQALVTPTSYGVPQRTSNGYDSRRLQMVLAVLEKRLGAQFQKNDVFVNITGGVSLSDTSVDLGVAAALISSLRDQALDAMTVIIGEIGLTGEVRSVANLERRIGECEKLGFKSVMIPQNSISKLSKKFDIKLLPTARISLALSTLFG